MGGAKSPLSALTRSAVRCKPIVCANEVGSQVLFPAPGVPFYLGLNGWCEKPIVTFNEVGSKRTTYWCVYWCVMRAPPIMLRVRFLLCGYYAGRALPIIPRVRFLLCDR